LSPALIYYISRNAPLLSRIFEGPFQTYQGWQFYLAQNLQWGATGVLNQMSWVQPRPASLFQALYVACWIYKPVEKGSYMIPLQPAVLCEKVRQAAEKLDSRWSSHLSKKGARSAGAGYAFLKGYAELLVQIEKDPRSDTQYLFLKTEGHGAMSLAHLSSYFTKLKTGEGDTQNEALHHFAKQGELGIAERAAENYSKAYEALLKNIGLNGKLVTAEQSIPRICEKLETKATLVNPEIWSRWKLQQTLIPDSGNKVDLADLVEKVIIPTVEQTPLRGGQHVSAVRDAAKDLLWLAKNLRIDARDLHAREFGSPQISRFFQEVRVSPQALDSSLTDFKSQLAREVSSR